MLNNYPQKLKLLSVFSFSPWSAVSLRCWKPSNLWMMKHQRERAHWNKPSRLLNKKLKWVIIVSIFSSLQISHVTRLILRQLLNSTDPEQRRGTPEELIRATKPITNATAKAVAAGKSGRQEDMVACANLGRKTVHDMVEACKVGIFLFCSKWKFLKTSIVTGCCCKCWQ